MFWNPDLGFTKVLLKIRFVFFATFLTSAYTPVALLEQTLDF